MTLNEFVQTHLKNWDQATARERFFEPEPDEVVQRKINTLTSLEELDGFERRNSLLKLKLPAWPETQRRMIAVKKVELQKGGYADSKIRK